MAFSHLFLSFLAAAGSVAGELQPVEVKGSKFFYQNGTQFFMKGVAYQQNSAAAGASVDKNVKYVDPLSDESSCKRDIPLLKELGTNTIRTYAIDPNADHKACMELLQEAGIYVISDLGEPNLSINRDAPQWNTELFTRYQKVVDELSQYSNVIGFFAGNEVSNAKNNTGDSVYVKAAVRDTKKYIKSQKKITRWLGVGYAANDDEDIRDQIAYYFNCDAVDTSIDFWGYNIYSWCGDSDMRTASYDKQVNFFQNYSVPVFFAEYGCNKVPGGAAGRPFTETEALYSDNMTGVFSGGIVYMYFQEDNDFGLVKVRKGEASRMDDFEALKTQIAKAHPTGVTIDNYKPDLKMSECPALNDKWQANKALPPTPDASLCECMVKSRSCVPKSGISPKKYGEIFGYICGSDLSLCAGINGNTSTGVYGAYSMCDDSAKLAYVLDAYQQKQHNAAGACDFDGAATAQKPASEASCSSALASASDANKNAATATAPGAGKATKAADSSAVHNASFPRVFSFGDLIVNFYALAVMCAGAAMIVL